jgi:hypothetical protein
MAKFHKKVIHGYNEIGSGRKTATPFGTPVSLASSTEAKVVIITPLASNTDVIVVGDVNIVASPIGSRRGCVIATPEGITLEIDNLADVYIQAAVSDEGVSFTYYK